MLPPYPILTTLLSADPAALLVLVSLSVTAAIPVYLIGHAFRLAELPRGTRGWRLPQRHSERPPEP